LLKEDDRRERVSRGRQACGFAKANYNAVIAGLMTLLAEGGKPEALPTLESGLQRGNDRVAKLCRIAGWGPRLYSGTISAAAIEGIIKALLEPASEALRAIFDQSHSAARLEIRKQLEAAKWRDFDEIRMHMEPEPPDTDVNRE
jgi:hypothetical protein